MRGDRPRAYRPATRAMERGFLWISLESHRSGGVSRVYYFAICERCRITRLRGASGFARGPPPEFAQAPTGTHAGLERRVTRRYSPKHHPPLTVGPAVLSSEREKGCFSVGARAMGLRNAVRTTQCGLPSIPFCMHGRTCASKRAQRQSTSRGSATHSSQDPVVPLLR